MCDIQSGSTTSSCAYECDRGYDGHDCITPLQNLIRIMGGEAAFSLIMTVLFLAILSCMACLRYGSRIHKRLKRRQRASVTTFDAFWDTLATKRMAQSDDLSPLPPQDLEDPLIPNDFQKKNTSVDTAALRRTASMDYDTSCCTGTGLATSFLQCCGFVPAPETARSSLADVRTMLKLKDTDLPKHAGRIYLTGKNAPLKVFGGPWRMPTAIPHHLMPMLEKEAYLELVREVNEALDWPTCGWEQLAMFFLTIATPPVAPFFLAWRRQVRARVFLKIISEYDHSAFR